MAYADAYQVCSPWIDPTDLCCEGVQTFDDCADGEQPLEFPWTDEQYILAASNLLFQRTGRRWPGLCEKTVYPCVRCNCRRGPCGRGCYFAIRLGRDFPVQSIGEVKIDGVILDPAAYRIDSDQDLVRIDGDQWPLCNTLGLPTSGPVCAELLVTYTAGRMPPIEGKLAAQELACEMKRACNGDDTCALPDHVRSLSRRGVSMELQDVAQLLQDGLTGNPTVDRFIEVHGRAKTRTMFVDPVAVRDDQTLEA